MRAIDWRLRRRGTLLVDVAYVDDREVARIVSDDGGKSWMDPATPHMRIFHRDTARKEAPERTSRENARLCSLLLASIKQARRAS